MVTTNGFLFMFVVIWGFVGKVRLLCAPPPSSPHSHFTPSVKVYYVGAYVTYGCAPGCKVEGPLKIQCVYSKAHGAHGWTGKPPKCLCQLGQQVHVCRVPPNPPHGLIYSRHPSKKSYLIGDSIRYRCKYGYTLDSNPRVHCLANGWSHSPKCLGYSQKPTHYCHRPDVPLHGRIFSYLQSKVKFLVGDVITYSCNYGYEPEGSAKVYCQIVGWSSVLKCVAKHLCAVPAIKWNAHVQPSSPLKGHYKRGESFTYSCKPGFCAVGEKKSRCGLNGWSKPPICHYGGCTLESSIQFNMKGKKHWCPGETVKFKCKPGYQLVGFSQVACGLDHKWKHPLPHCKAACKIPAPPNHGYIQGNQLPSAFLTDGQFFVYGCAEGYCGYGNNKIYCDNSRWTHTPVCNHGGCTLEGTHHYNMNGKKHWCPGETIKFKCNPGYQLVGFSQVACGLDHKWKHPLPYCKAGCTMPTPPNHGHIQGNHLPNTLFNNGQFFVYGCDDGYCRYGNNKIYCANSRWTHTPVCNLACPLITAPLHGSFTRNNNYQCPGNTVHFVCDEGYKLIGFEFLMCSVAGIWSKAVPVCKKLCTLPGAPDDGWIFVDKPHQVLFEEDQFFTYGCQSEYCRQGAEKVQCRGTGWSHHLSCNPSCPQLTAPMFGMFSRNEGLRCPGVVVQFACNTDFNLVGEALLTCSATSQWNHEVPTCRRSCTLALSPGSQLQVADPSNSVYEEDAQIVLSCAPGYCLQGEAIVYCRQDGWTTFPTCRQGCQRRQLPSRLSYITDQPVWCASESARFNCDSGYQVIGARSSTCGEDGSWSSDVPLCQSVCIRPANPTNGFIVSDAQTQDTFSATEMVVYICNFGFCLDSTPQVICGTTGWSHQPTCTMGCPYRQPPVYGSYVTNRTMWCSNELAIYQCLPGFRLVGSETSLCGRNGVWSGSVPRCERIQEPNIVTMVPEIEPPFVPPSTSAPPIRTTIPTTPPIRTTIPPSIEVIPGTLPSTTEAAGAVEGSMNPDAVPSMEVPTTTLFVEQTPPPVFPRRTTVGFGTAESTTEVIIVFPSESRTTVLPSATAANGTIASGTSETGGSGSITTPFNITDILTEYVDPDAK